MTRRVFSKWGQWLSLARSGGSCAVVCRAVFAVAIAAAFAPIASGQIASLDKGHQLLINDGLQIWGLNTDNRYQFNYANLADANMDAVIWSTNQSSTGLLSAGENWGKWIEP